MTSVVISQPLYFAWPGFIDQLRRAEVLIWLDDAQFSKGSFVNRNRVICDGSLRWLTIPLVGKGTFQSILDLRANDPNWRVAHAEVVKRAYEKTPNFDEVEEIFAEATDATSVHEVAARSSMLILDSLGQSPGLVLYSSQMGVVGRSSERVLALVKAVGGTSYITGHGAANYLDHEAFERSGVEIEYMQYFFKPWRDSVWANTYGISYLDLLAHGGLSNFTDHLLGRQINWREFINAKNSRY